MFSLQGEDIQNLVQEAKLSSAVADDSSGAVGSVSGEQVIYSHPCFWCVPTTVSHGEVLLFICAKLCLQCQLPMEELQFIVEKGSFEDKFIIME